MRLLIRTVHRWIAIGLMVLLIPISLSGAFLVWHDEIDAIVHPNRYTTAGGDVALPPSGYLANATAALERGVRPVAIRFSAGARPVTVMARGGPRSEGALPRVVTVYLDPPSGRVLDVVDFRSSLVGMVHRFHENLAIPEYSGRQIAGWAGVGMLILALTGLWLWWPRNAFFIGLRWRRSPATTANIHHLVGFWISLPLALLSATGVYLAFPQTARNAMSAIAAMAPQGARPGQRIASDIASTPDQALAAALAAEPGASAVALFMAAPDPRADDAPVWRVQVRRPAGGGDLTLLVDDRTRAVRPLPDPLAGDRAAQMIRWIHQGEAGGPLWRVMVFLCGIMPGVLGVTGILVWLRGRRRRRLTRSESAAPRLEAAE
jgi:uncharacterized iron-regulated membrane protein